MIQTLAFDLKKPILCSIKSGELPRDSKTFQTFFIMNIKALLPLVVAVIVGSIIYDLLAKPLVKKFVPDAYDNS